MPAPRINGTDVGADNGPGLTAARFRQVLGHFCTGVTVITTVDSDGRPAGFACQAFAALSLDPPLVVFCPSRTSSTWRVIERSGHFAANVLAESQRDLARVFGAPAASSGAAGSRGLPGSAGGDKFAGVTWSASASGAPVLAGALAWAACTLEAVHDGGDHLIVTGRVTELGDIQPGEPLLFYRGRYGATVQPGGPPEVVDTLLAWPRHSDWM